MFVPEFTQHLAASPKKPDLVLVVGIEAHICITQMGPRMPDGPGYRGLFVLADDVSSCNRE